MGPLWLFVIVVFVLLPAYIVGATAHRRGRSPILWGVPAGLLGWFGLLLLLPLREGRHDPDGTLTRDTLDRLTAITQLREAGTLSDSEYEAERSRLLAGRRPPQ